ncbi:alpha/beta hydrolase [Pontiella sulfatireligans]|uniref:AB hydrolase-1 domain-containing protein n=1 Tax=Pontiella sulfatireligans TaxID=2750658 RepID=A0A6C2UKE9_9BACT|nr:alpha/beta hydrolase [Pontiella sulfatireligans]VGO19784.1 hypothetical protein SCARR_01843 [Pontiella sulfatireligans]
MKYTLIAALFLTGTLTANSGTETSKHPYFFPFVNPFEATVLPLPDAYKADLVEKVPSRDFKLNVFPDREVPSVFWYQKGLKCSLTLQKKEAPLIFVVAGTGAQYKSPKMLVMKRQFYEAGFHVVCITSPTHMNFVVNASSGMPGNTPEDAKDLYRVMEMADAYAKKKKAKISGYALTGYSLGGIESAFVAKLDSERRVFNFDRVLLVNPPADVYVSINRLNQMLVENIPGGVENFGPWIEDTIQMLANDAKESGISDFSGDSIYKLYRYYPPREDFLKALIGLSFRMSSADMVFAVDVMNGGGYVVPQHVEFKASSSLGDYPKVCYRTSFVDYFDEWFFPFYAQQEPGLTQEALIHRASLYELEPFLKGNPKIGLLHNEDDVIMGPGQVEYLKSIFGDRSKIFPIGGHCGNMSHPDVMQFMTDFLTGKIQAK